METERRAWTAMIADDNRYLDEYLDELNAQKEALENEAVDFFE